MSKYGYIINGQTLRSGYSTITISEIVIYLVLLASILVIIANIKTSFLTSFTTLYITTIASSISTLDQLKLDHEKVQFSYYHYN